MVTVDKIIGKLAIPIIAIAGVLLIIIITLSSQGTDNENNAYIRVINCVVSIPATTRTQSDIESCYLTVENDLNVDLRRYDGSSNK